MGRKLWGLGIRVLVGASGGLAPYGYAAARPLDKSESTAPPAQPSGHASHPSPERSIYIPEDTTAHNHDGFLFEGSIGGALLRARVEDPVTGNATITASGLGLGFAIGGTPFRGLALGLSGVSIAIFDRNFDRETPHPTGAEQSVGFLSYGVFVKYWPDPRGGFQLEAVGGVAALWASEDDEPAFGRDHGLPVGPSFGAGVGFQMWMKPQQSVGAMARLVYAPLSGDWSASVFMPTLSLIVSIH